LNSFSPRKGAKDAKGIKKAVFKFRASVILNLFQNLNQVQIDKKES
tara:strand:- start:441 stop:578 length:138 start_codon:yes stop_codon:yes gene_type:complete